LPARRLVLEGKVVVEHACERYLLIGREALTFDSILPHRFCNESDKPSVYLFAITSPVP
jgi:hypothetical protein